MFIPLGGSLLHYITVGLCDQQLSAEVTVCHFWEEVVKRLWIPYESFPSLPPPPQSWVTPCWRSSFPDVHSLKKIPPGRNSWPGTLAASGWRRELGNEFFNPAPALTNILVTSWENVSQGHLAKSLTLHQELCETIVCLCYAGMCPCRSYTATNNWETRVQEPRQLSRHHRRSFPVLWESLMWIRLALNWLCRRRWQTPDPPTSTFQVAWL